MKDFVCDLRLLTCAGLVRQGAVLADIGTDHAYLPIFLLRNHRISAAVLSDVNEGPLASARQNAEECGVMDRCTIVLADGASALVGMGITDYAICGMGGELIARIIVDAPHLRERGIRLILQPMSRPEVLRRTLSSLGFEILDERYSSADGKFYLTILAEFADVEEKTDPVWRFLGDFNPLNDRENQLGYLSRRLCALEHSLQGKRLGGVAAYEEELLIPHIKQRISALQK